MRRVFETIIGLTVFVLFLWGIYQLFALTFETLTKLDNDIATAILAASTTIIISVVSILLGKYLERRSTIEKELREKKIPSYEKLTRFFFELLYKKEKLGQELPEDQLINEFSEITQGLMIWGSDSVIKKWSEFRQVSSNPNQLNESYKTLFLLESLLLEIRKDIGYKGYNLQEGDILGLFVNDITNEIKKAKSDK